MVSNVILPHLLVLCLNGAPNISHLLYFLLHRPSPSDLQAAPPLLSLWHVIWPIRIRLCIITHNSALCLLTVSLYHLIDYREGCRASEDLFWKLTVLQQFIAELNWPDEVLASHLMKRLKLMASDMVQSSVKR